MSVIASPLPVKLFVGILSRDVALLDQCTDNFRRTFGPADFLSPLLPWDHTDYYEGEMGKELFRRFVFAAGTIDPGRLSEIKHITNGWEATLAEHSTDGLRRNVNIDPGYVTEAKVVLATGKDFPHRVYIGNGIYAEATLRYERQKNEFQPWEYTYPDFRREDVRGWFNDARKRLRAEIKRSTDGRRGSASRSGPV